ncbi:MULTISPECIES: LysR family transcriptional regulator [Paraburkholderia]|uniref:LysR family transcriptional regulator n=1 Tax=Paraburkholderia unamae TaxID=219649 RepID=A0ACC6RGN1_9BURK
MNTLQNMNVFVRVVEAGSFTAAAESLDISAGSASRAINELETHLRTRLLNRTTRRIALTSAGVEYLDRCRRILADVAKAEEDMTHSRVSPSGILRIHSFASFGQHYIIPVISEYRRRYPDVKIEVRLSQDIPDLLDGSCDSSILAVSSMPDSDAVLIRLGSTFDVLCASPAYLSTHGAPTEPADLSSHECLALSTPTVRRREWQFDGPRGKEQRVFESALQLDNAEALAATIRQGMGIGALPVHAALAGLSDGSLVRVLPDYTVGSREICAVHPSRHFVDARTRTWHDLLRTCVPQALERNHAQVNALRTAVSGQTIVKPPFLDKGGNHLTLGAVLTH